VHKSNLCWFQVLSTNCSGIVSDWIVTLHVYVTVTLWCLLDVVAVIWQGRRTTNCHPFPVQQLDKDRQRADIEGPTDSSVGPCGTVAASHWTSPACHSLPVWLLCFSCLCCHLSLFKNFYTEVTHFIAYRATWLMLTTQFLLFRLLLCNDFHRTIVLRSCTMFML